MVSLLRKDIFHHQTSTSDPTVKRITYYDSYTNTMRSSLVLFTHQKQPYLHLFMCRTRMAQFLAQLSNNYISEFSSKINIRFFDQAEKDRILSNMNAARLISGLISESSPQVNDSAVNMGPRIQISVPYQEGMITLADYIKRNCIQYKKNRQLMKKIIQKIVNLMIRISDADLFIPTFRNMLINPETLQIAPDLLSIAAIDIMLNSETISTATLKETHPFVLGYVRSSRKCSHINTRHALAILILGLILGKEITLSPKIPQSKTITRAQFQKIIQSNKIKINKLVNCQRVQKQLKQIQETYTGKLRLTTFLTQTLIDRKYRSWGYIIQQLFYAPLSKEAEEQEYLIQLLTESRDDGNKEGKGYYTCRIDVQDYVVFVANQKWQRQNKQDRQKMINNGIVSADSLKLDSVDSQIYLIYAFNVPLSVLKKYRYSFSRFLHCAQNTQKSHFSSDCMEIYKKFEKEALFELQKNNHIDRRQGLRFDNELSSSLSEGPIESKEYNSMPEAIENESLNDQIKLFKNQANPIKKQANSSQSQHGNPANPQENKIKKGRAPLFRSDYKKSTFRQGSSSQRFKLSLQMWKEPLLHKFESKGQEGKVGIALSDRLVTLRAYAKSAAFDSQDEDQL